MPNRLVRSLCTAALLITAPGITYGQQAGVPVLPETAARDDDGNLTVRAVRVDTPINIDGRLEESLYETVNPISNFIQNEPVNGALATERTEIWLAFDNDNIYVGIRAFESEPDRMIANTMQRDSFDLLQNENVAVMFDTFNDRRSGILLQWNPIGGRWDGQMSGGANANADWNPVWELATAEFEGGWTSEAAIPFKSISYGSGDEWGFNARRINKWKNEISHLTPLPAGRGISGVSDASFATPLVGMEAPPSSRTIDIKPYAIADLSTDVRSGVSNNTGGDAGLDARLSITPNLSADFTVNTDFAQVEADDQQVNLTRFSLFFP